MVQRIEDWPESSHGAWVIKDIRNYLGKKLFLTIEEQNAWFNSSNIGLFDGMSAVHYVHYFVNSCVAISYSDAWQMVLRKVKAING